MKLEGKSLKSDFLKFIIPSIIAQWVFTLYTMIDGIFVAKGVSETALTAVNISFPFVAGLFSISILFAVGTSTVVAILFGEKNEKRANEVFTQNIVMLILLSLLITAAVCAISGSERGSSSVCKGIHWNDRSFCGLLYPVVFF